MGRAFLVLAAASVLIPFRAGASSDHDNLAGMKKQAVRRNRASVTIDVLECQRRLKAGTLSAEDKATLERILPGVLDDHGNVKPKPQDSIQETSARNGAR